MKQQRNTRQRQLVLDVVRGRRDHPTAEQIYQSVREQDAHVSRGTVYRNLNLLCDNREIYREGSKDNTISHFYEKLLLIKDRMNTRAGRRIARQRHRFLESFLSEFFKEMRL